MNMLKGMSYQRAYQDKECIYYNDTKFTFLHVALG